jgi:CheY-like chemotaxis protein
MDGAKLVAAIRGRKGFAETPVLMMGAVSASHPNAAGADGALMGWLNKPVRRAQLHACLVSLQAEGRTVEVKRLKEAGHIIPATEPRRRQGSRIRRLLLVEDNPVNQEVAQAMLQELGIEAVSAWDGEEALQRLAKDRFEVVLMDCQMPKLDGYATTMRFREAEKRGGHARTPIIALTANALDGDAQKCFAAGMDGYLSKPFSIEQLYRALGRYEPAAPEPDSSLETEVVQTTVLDEQALAQIRALHRPGGPNLLARVVGLYLTNSSALIDSLRESLPRRDVQALLQAAHALKSSSANVGAIVLAELCGNIEMAAKGGDLEAARAILARLGAEHESVLRALDAQTAAA